jgi:hypothetical protein
MSPPSLAYARLGEGDAPVRACESGEAGRYPRGGVFALNWRPLLTRLPAASRRSEW